MIQARFLRRPQHPALSVLLVLALLLGGATGLRAHEPLVVETQLVVDEQGAVVVTLRMRQSALLAATGWSHLAIQSQDELLRAVPAIGDYLQAHTELCADGERVTLTFDEASAVLAEDPMILKLHGQLPVSLARISWRMSCFTNDAGFSSVIAQGTLQWHGETSPPQTNPAGTICTWLASDFLPAAAPDTTAGNPIAPASTAAPDDDHTPPGSATPPPPSPAVVRPSAPPVNTGSFRQFLQLGFLHILPQGLDHILFVLGIFLLSPKLKPLLTQITAFTIAHSITLGLSIAGIVMLPSRVVEPLIALSIAVVAIENIFTRVVHSWRWMVVFAFGLVHGLGFASALHALHLQPDTILVPLVGFNLGVELGQLSVVAIAATLTFWAWKRPWYRRYITIPGSAVIALIGLFWAVQRALGFGMDG